MLHKCGDSAYCRARTESVRFSGNQVYSPTLEGDSITYANNLQGKLHLWQSDPLPMGYHPIMASAPSASSPARDIILSIGEERDKEKPKSFSPFDRKKRLVIADVNTGT